MRCGSKRQLTPLELGGAAASAAGAGRLSAVDSRSHVLERLHELHVILVAQPLAEVRLHILRG